MSTPPLSTWELRGELTLAALPNAVSCARLLVTHTLLKSQVDGAAIRIVERATEELVAHAVATTGVSAAVPIYDAAFEHLALITVRLYLTSEQAGLEVWDCGARPPHPRLGQTTAMQMSTAWGHDRPAPGQRVVWCLLPLGPAAASGQPSGTTPTHQPDLLQRVLDGLHRMDAPAPGEDT